MLHGFQRCVVACCLMGPMLTASFTNADIIKLGNGGEIRGTIKRDAKAAGPDGIVIETLTGAEVVVEQEQVQFVTTRKLVVEEYETRRKRNEDTLDSHLEMADWCRRKRLTQQRIFHLECVLRFDPDHAAAHHGLGHTKWDGQWMSRDEVMQDKGLVKYRGRYITPEELALRQKTDVERKSELAWFKRIRLWHGWLSGRDNQRRAKAVAELNQVNDPDAVAALIRFLGQDKQRSVRQFQVDILAKMPGENPVKPLVYVSLIDSEADIRSSAFQAIGVERHDMAYGFYVEELASRINVVVRRAAEVLGQIGDQDVVPDLIDALVTRHRHQVRVQGSGSPTYSFARNAANGAVGASSPLPPQIELQLRTGQLPYGVKLNRTPTAAERQTRIITVQQNHQNREVLSALVKLTGQNFGYDERTWRLWWTAGKNSTEQAAKIPQ